MVEKKYLRCIFCNSTALKIVNADKVNSDYLRLICINCVRYQMVYKGNVVNFIIGDPNVKDLKEWINENI